MVELSQVIWGLGGRVDQGNLKCKMLSQMGARKIRKNKDFRLNLPPPKKKELLALVKVLFNA